MKKTLIELANTVHWDRVHDDKVYLENVQVGIHEFPFTVRQVVLRFDQGPALDLSIVDMDRIAIAYFKLRGIRLPAKAYGLANVTNPPRCDFLVPSQLLNEHGMGKGPETSPLPGKFTDRKGQKRDT